MDPYSFLTDAGQIWNRRTITAVAAHSEISRASCSFVKAPISCQEKKSEIRMIFPLTILFHCVVFNLFHLLGSLDYSKSNASYLFSMETTTKKTTTPFDRENSQVQNTIFQHSQHRSLCIFTRHEQEPACHGHKNLHQWTGFCERSIYTS